MTPNNNFSVLPWYKSKTEQNAQKWWVNGRIFPLYSPNHHFLPFQVLREHFQAETPTPLPIYEEYDETTLRDDGEMMPMSDAIVTIFDIPEGVTSVHFIDPEDELTGSCFCAMLDENGEVIGTYPNDIAGGAFDMALPTGTTQIRVVTFSGGVAIIPPELVTYYEPTQSMVTLFEVYDTNDNLVGDFLSDVKRQGIKIVPFAEYGYDAIVYPATGVRFWDAIPDGQYYAKMSDGVNTWFSEVFTMVQDLTPYLKIEWYDLKDFVMESGRIVYENPAFKNVLYLPSEIAKPTYEFEDETQDRDGYSFPTKQVSKKVYHFSFFAPEYLLDVVRFVRMADFVTISHKGQDYKVDSFLITPEWESNGDIASVDAEFSTDTIAKKTGLAYIKQAER